MAMEDLPRSARATRGRRLTKLLDEETEADNTFWGQEAFKEENNDKEYEQEAVQEVDEFDSDFDDEEDPESDHEGDKEEKEIVRKKRKLPYKKPDKKKKSVSFLLKAKDKQPSKPKKKAPAARPSEEDGGEEGGEGERIIRKSSRMSVVAKQAERAAKAALYTPKPVKRRKEEEKKMSQEEMLLEAAQTEVINLQSLERMLAREEEVKKKAIIQKILYTGPQIKFISKDGRNVLEFTKTGTLPSVINSKAKPYPERAVCVVTGLPARYKDPKTGQPYATKEAFKILRERYTKGDKGVRRDSSSTEEIHQRKRSKVEAERDKAGVVKLKLSKASPTTTTGEAQHHHQQVQSPAQTQAQDQAPESQVSAPALAPDEIEAINEADFALDGLEDLPRSYAIEDSILYETNEMTEASFRSGDFLLNKILLQQRLQQHQQQQQQQQR